MIEGFQWNEFFSGGLPSPAFPPYILVECKNWSEKVSSNEVSWFDTKLRDRGLFLGILIATCGITGDPQRLTDAHIFKVRYSGVALPQAILHVLYHNATIFLERKYHLMTDVMSTPIQRRRK